MKTITVRIPTPLRAYTHGADEVRAEGATVADAMRALGDAYDGLLAQVLTEDGEPRQFVNIYLGSRNVRALQGMRTPVAEGDVISIVPAVAGGRA
ncbi:MAG: molybdopterin synthase sulfur carrier subunit [Betaproteobacteria bacterium RIFCSPLOWO2_12_FULL_63_13]|nr:MAG: molybdopterin synthase sulfur carrier subunit [Betaproteobacteria bacterium RIFCSPLOWO2_02_FULL_63_19]OGA47711.1 MAG: molybdopterin synthase sulfur carrier subunit [Betaproteobacteria bacterium RIFCSPLOWO2_12_FULL_63_13]